MNLIVAIDGATRRNGKENCVASGGVYIELYDEGKRLDTKLLSNYEIGSTNQRGELLALITALDYIWSAKQPALIVTDSEYIFNAMTKEWYVGWRNRNWLTASNEPVKNKDMWKSLCHSYSKCIEAGIDITFYHIKGHCIPFGKVTANKLLDRDPTGVLLHREVVNKYNNVATTSRREMLSEANILSTKNNGFALDEFNLKRFVVMNTIADIVATRCVEAADKLFLAQVASNGS